MKQKMNFILNFILHTNFAKSFLSRDFRFAVPPYFNTKIVITYTKFNKILSYLCISDTRQDTTEYPHTTLAPKGKLAPCLVSNLLNTASFYKGQKKYTV